ncbi:hypothetical protein CCACVL1_29995 [Corchorus capsularis]|uniref:Uncharacterized protein n=1 Tax=Corchorus capsularis TaxID=210143 RepID=A0A1R3FZ72_COCAP|nr:hypothetical protein CCACVL1_29995 [Corchorus capsularis]
MGMKLTLETQFWHFVAHGKLGDLLIRETPAVLGLVLVLAGFRGEVCTSRVPGDSSDTRREKLSI